MKKTILFTLVLLLAGCYPDETLTVPVTQPNVQLETDLDKFIETNFREKYGMAIRYRFVDRYIKPTQRVAPPKLEVVQPMLDFIQKFWIDPFLEVQNGEAYFRTHVPAEVVLLGGFIYNDDGTVVLGTADAGAQITFTYVNAIDPADKEWEALQLHTVYHEFAHIVHQRHKLPPDFEKISPAGYTSPGFWVSLSDEDALIRGFVSPYATSSPNEDFAETVAFYLYNQDFITEFMTDEPNCLTPECEARNAGRELVREKLTAIMEHYKKVVGVDLEAVRNAVQAKLN
ncbi:MAG TPA: putative zinc-binding metallopeptidase [Cyclobacteriaceae bacterium]|nr:putative zinc-binding metallopeptidase [Cyclobacteriaceae bacterium]MCB9236568.1 putative zinc-binding metallopeptidase [Flammeovirgaceae bacterium]MCB0500694.1 putative zinc-binding metallopeptidase [Cyclobacteriaceae bacterium]MCO5273172.1 putative zinc-binding metallopeptidase [Cyclobacteriaceae bacterium]MCW5903233.1 putative zinc-binding metallopeptidase [Cyclobacteriaceae bacterium]